MFHLPRLTIFLLSVSLARADPATELAEMEEIMMSLFPFRQTLTE